MLELLPTALPPELLGINWLDPQYLLNHFGSYALWGAAAIIFAECGLLVGFFLPGDSLLFTAGVLLSQGHIGYPIWLVCLVLAVAAVLGNASGYAIGSYFGESVFHGSSSRFFKQEYVDRTHAFFEKYGNRAVVLGRFVPIVRTFITVMAGVGTMGFRRFITYSAIGAVLWVGVVTLLGYYLGQIAFLRAHIELLLLVLVLISVLPLGVEYLRQRASSKMSATSDES